MTERRYQTPRRAYVVLIVLLAAETGWLAYPFSGDRDILPRDVISRKLSVPNAERIFFIRHALHAGFTIEEILI